MSLDGATAAMYGQGYYIGSQGQGCYNRSIRVYTHAVMHQPMYIKARLTGNQMDMVGHEPGTKENTLLHDSSL